MPVSLDGVPETMLWTLHNRATEAKRADRILEDAEAVRIYDAIDYDYERSFGPAEPSHAVRSKIFDRMLSAFLTEHPDGVIVNLGEGLETQRFRLPTTRALWLTVDLPSAIAAREAFIQPDAQHLHIAASATDPSWFDAVPSGRPVFLTAQGLLMYLPPAAVGALLQQLSRRFPGSSFAFDVIPGWFSRRTLRGYAKTAHYTTPEMPWGVDRHQLGPTLRGWVPDLAEIEEQPYTFPRGMQRWVFPLVRAVPVLSRYMPAIVRVRFAEAS